MKRDLVVYHKNCMDGLAAGFVAADSLESGIYVPLQYGEEEELFNMEISKDDVIYFVDFSLKRDQMIKLCSIVNKVIVLDHHKTADENLRHLEDQLENIEIVFDMNKSGAMIAYDYFKSDLAKDIFEYIQDRDLWNWDLPYSKEISEYLRLMVKPNDINSFKEVYENFDYEEAATVGELLLKKVDISVASKIKKTKDLTIFGIKLKCLNATENISEIGNAICNTYDRPALIYFIKEDDQVVCSFRSLDTLADVSKIAKSLGGGGHRNACGCTLTLEQFFSYDFFLTVQEEN